MESGNKKRSTLIPHAWFKSLEKLPDDVAGRIYKAVQRLDITGEMTVFEEGSIEDVLFSQYAFQTDEFGQNYAKTCENRSKAAKDREARKKAQKAQSENLVPQAKSFVDDRSGVDRSGVDRSGKDRSGVDVSGVDVSGKDASPPAADTTTTSRESIEEDIIDAWHWQDCTTELRSLGGKRWDRTEMAMAVAGGRDQFIELIRSLDSQAYFQTHRVDYDWFVDPKNFQNILEGKYKEPHKPARREGWE